MDLEIKQIEGQLKELMPADLPESLLDRLDFAMLSVAAEASPAEEKIIVASSDTELAVLEERLRSLRPFGVPENMISRLDDAMSRWHEEVPVEEKVVAIHPERAEKLSSWFGLRSVAAVGVLGAAAAFLTNSGKPEAIAESQRIPILSNGSAAPAVFTPKEAQASVVMANDRGVIWTKAGKPVRCTEVHFSNRLQFVNQKGERLILEQPKREVRFTPVKFD